MGIAATTVAIRATIVVPGTITMAGATTGAITAATTATMAAAGLVFRLVSDAVGTIFPGSAGDPTNGPGNRRPLSIADYLHWASTLACSYRLRDENVANVTTQNENPL